MQKLPYSLLASTILFTGCLSIKVPSTEPDSALLLLLDNRQLTVTSLNSAVQTSITSQERQGDTLVLTYRKGTFLRQHANTMELTENTRFIRCAKQLYRVVATDTGRRLERL